MTIFRTCFLLKNVFPLVLKFYTWNCLCSWSTFLRTNFHTLNSDDHQKTSSHYYKKLRKITNDIQDNFTTLLPPFTTLSTWFPTKLMSFTTKHPSFTTILRSLTTIYFHSLDSFQWMDTPQELDYFSLQMNFEKHL